MKALAIYEQPSAEWLGECYVPITPENIKEMIMRINDSEDAVPDPDNPAVYHMEEIKHRTPSRNTNSVTTTLCASANDLGCYISGSMSVWPHSSPTRSASSSSATASALTTSKTSRSPHRNSQSQESKKARSASSSI